MNGALGEGSASAGGAGGASQNRAVMMWMNKKMDLILEPKHSPRRFPRAGLSRSIGAGIWELGSGIWYIYTPILRWDQRRSMGLCAQAHTTVRWPLGPPNRPETVPRLPDYKIDTFRSMGLCAQAYTTVRWLP